ncbi:hypothetical protein SAMN06265360_102213 [Haloechinothrix alba]|uniref:Uncharacterized protein n=1 Tax=Haloechinothrix alba TaxID=664784 RepID=A0A238VID7_9PSEU|nr:DUF5819 family protein [Haloechinothrix alba]SNR33259.1 hypothetical protein SAMN06265360_102213 [Haloechinothrix alba]
MDEPGSPERAHREGSVLSRTSRVIVAAGAGLLAIVLTFHLAMMFFHVAPSNVVSREFSGTVNGYVYPEFRQNWKLFAPEPVHVNREVHARVVTRDEDGEAEISRWYDVTAAEIEATRGNLAPSQTRNQLRKAWRTLTSTLDEDERPRNEKGEITAGYVKRVALLRISTAVDLESVEQLQARAVTTYVPEPGWSERTTDDEPSTRTLPWWDVDEADFPEGSAR